MNLKALADKVLQRDRAGTLAGTDSHKLSHGYAAPGQLCGTVIDFLEAVEERAAIMEHNAPEVYPARAAATAAAYEECRIIFLRHGEKANE